MFLTLVVVPVVYIVVTRIVEKIQKLFGMKVSTVTSWLNFAKAKVGSKKIMLTETCMGDGCGILQNCGSPSKQLAYADTLLSWYNSDTSKIVGMTWFTAIDPYLGWQTPNTLWNTCRLVDSNGVTVQPAGTLWRHDCTTTGMESINQSSYFFTFFIPKPFFHADSFADRHSFP